MFKVLFQEALLEFDDELKLLRGITRIWILPSIDGVVSIHCRNSVIHSLDCDGSPVEFELADCLTYLPLLPGKESYNVRDIYDGIQLGAENASTGEISLRLPIVTLSDAEIDRRLTKLALYCNNADDIRRSHCISISYSVVQFSAGLLRIQDENRFSIVSSSIPCQSDPGGIRCWVPCVDDAYQHHHIQLAIKVKRGLSIVSSLSIVDVDDAVSPLYLAGQWMDNIILDYLADFDSTSSCLWLLQSSYPIRPCHIGICIANMMMIHQLPLLRIISNIKLQIVIPLSSSSSSISTYMSETAVSELSRGLEFVLGVLIGCSTNRDENEKCMLSLVLVPGLYSSYLSFDGFSLVDVGVACSSHGAVDDDNSQIIMLQSIIHSWLSRFSSIIFSPSSKYGSISSDEWLLHALSGYLVHVYLEHTFGNEYAYARYLRMIDFVLDMKSDGLNCRLSNIVNVQTGLECLDKYTPWRWDLMRAKSTIMLLMIERNVNNKGVVLEALSILISFCRKIRTIQFEKRVLIDADVTASASAAVDDVDDDGSKFLVSMHALCEEPFKYGHALLSQVLNIAYSGSDFYIGPRIEWFLSGDDVLFVRSGVTLDERHGTCYIAAQRLSTFSPIEPPSSWSILNVDRQEPIREVKIIARVNEIDDVWDKQLILNGLKCCDCNPRYHSRKGRQAASSNHSSSALYLSRVGYFRPISYVLLDPDGGLICDARTTSSIEMCVEQAYSCTDIRHQMQAIRALSRYRHGNPSGNLAAKALRDVIESMGNDDGLTHSVIVRCEALLALSAWQRNHAPHTTSSLSSSSSSSSWYGMTKLINFFCSLYIDKTTNLIVKPVDRDSILVFQASVMALSGIWSRNGCTPLSIISCIYHLVSNWEYDVSNEDDVKNTVIIIISVSRLRPSINDVKAVQLAMKCISPLKKMMKKDLLFESRSHSVAACVIECLGVLDVQFGSSSLDYTSYLARNRRRAIVDDDNDAVYAFPVIWSAIDATLRIFCSTSYEEALTFLLDVICIESIPSHRLKYCTSLWNILQRRSLLIAPWLLGKGEFGRPCWGMNPCGSWGVVDLRTDNNNDDISNHVKSDRFASPVYARLTATLKDNLCFDLPVRMMLIMIAARIYEENFVPLQVSIDPCQAKSRLEREFAGEGIGELK